MSSAALRAIPIVYGKTTFKYSFDLELPPLSNFLLRGSLRLHLRLTLCRSLAAPNNLTTSMRPSQFFSPSICAVGLCFLGLGCFFSC